MKGKVHMAVTCSDSVSRLRLNRIGTVAITARIAMDHITIRVAGGASNPYGAPLMTMYAAKATRHGICLISDFERDSWPWNIHRLYGDELKHGHMHNIGEIGEDRNDAIVEKDRAKCDSAGWYRRHSESENN